MIPKIIHFCWFGGNPIPDEYKKYMASWTKHCPDYEIVRWDDSNYDITKNPYMHEAYKAKKWAFVSDYARLDIIYNHGGIYLDTDVELLRNIDDLLVYEAFAGFEDGKHIALGLGFGAVKGHSTVKELRDIIYDSLVFLKKDGTYELTPSPKHQTTCMTSKGLAPNNKKQVVAGITILPTEYLCPKDYATGRLKKTKNTYSIHHFSASWFSEEERREYLKSQSFQKVFGKTVGAKLYNASYIFRTAGIRGVRGKIKEQVKSQSKPTS